MSTIVQFTHPGSEHEPDKKGGNHKSWNDGQHKRKFMLCDGSYVGADNRLLDDKLIFWGEWEPPSKVDAFVHQPDDQFPKWLHTPILPKEIPTSGTPQNTDPFVFDGCFKYFLCQQFQKKSKNSTQLGKLEKGSIILFGSGKGQKRKTAFFQLDTVFVVSDYIEYDPSDPDALNQENLGNYRDIVFKMGFPEPYDRSLTLRLYFGATYEKPVEGMYSFSPSKIYKNNEQGFPRVRLQDMDYITNNKTQGYKITSKPKEEVKDFWVKIRDISRAQGCVEGVNFKYNIEQCLL